MYHTVIVKCKQGPNMNKPEYGAKNSRTVSARLLLEDVKRLHKAAKREKVSPSEFNRDAILEEIRISEESEK